jgi:hypothetical protein
MAVELADNPEKHKSFNEFLQPAADFFCRRLAAGSAAKSLVFR